MTKVISGRSIMLAQEAERKQFIIDCSLAMTHAWEAAFREAAKDFPAILKALTEKDPAAS